MEWCTTRANGALRCAFAWMEPNGEQNLTMY